MKYQSTIFSQLLELLPKDKFQSIVDKYKGDFKTHKLSCWTQFVAMLYSQMRNRHSLRDIENGLCIYQSKLYHLGITPTKRSTLSDANKNRPYQIYEETFQFLLQKCQLLAKKQFKHYSVLSSLDASIIGLCHSLCPWSNFQHTKGGLKLHLHYDHSSDLPEFVTITSARASDLSVARQLTFKPDSIIVFDRGYRDYSWYQDLHNSGSTFVTRLHSTASYSVIGQHDSDPNSTVVSDQDILIPAKRSHKKRRYTNPIRLVIYHDPETDKELRFLTNSETLSPETIARIYKDRWKIELFFKWIKQHLKLKTFLGTSKNAVLTQIWIAMILYLLLWFIKQQTRFKHSLDVLSTIIFETIFERVHLIEILALKPREKIPSFDHFQLALSFP